MRVPLALISALSLACVALWANADDSPASEGKKPTLWASIAVTTPIVYRDMADDFMIHFGLVNDGTESVDTDIDHSQLLVNGKEMAAWRLIVVNGPMDDRRGRLGAGRFLIFGYAMRTCFEKPGVYTLVWKGKGFQSPAVTFRVMPK